MSGTYSKSGLQCSHGSELDTKIPRPKMPKTALPPGKQLIFLILTNRFLIKQIYYLELRQKLGLKPRRAEETGINFYPS